MNTNLSNEPQGYDDRQDRMPEDVTMPDAVGVAPASGREPVEVPVAAPEPVAPTMPAERIAPAAGAPAGPGDPASWAPPPAPAAPAAAGAATPMAGPGGGGVGAPMAGPGVGGAGTPPPAGFGGNAGTPPPPAGAAGEAGVGGGAGAGSGAGPFRRQGAWVAIVLTIVGGLAGTYTLFSNVWDSAVAMPTQAREGYSSGFVPWGGGAGPWQDDVPTFDWTDTVAVDDVTSIAVDGRSSELTILYGGVDEAVLDVSTTAGSMPDWQFEVVDGVLTVSETERAGAGGPFEWSRTTATLTLPHSLRDSAPALTATMQSGALSIAGDFGDVELTTQSGAVSFEGAATTISCDLQSGAGDLTIYDAEAIDASVGSGVLGIDVEGEQPASTVLDVRSGYADLTLPAGPYDVTGTVSSGARDIDVETSSDAESTLEVNVRSGAATVSQHGS